MLDKVLMVYSVDGPHPALLIYKDLFIKLVHA